MDFIKEIAKQIPDEICGYNKYMELAQMTENEEYKTKLINIAEQEKNHYIEIKNILDNELMQ